MAETDPISAVVVKISLPDGLEQLRRHHDSSAARSVPAHVTLLFPFLPVVELSSAVRAVLAGIAHEVPAFEVRFAEVGRFPDVVYLVPEPPAPFVRLTASLAERFPEFPPYGGAYRDVVPHLTVTESTDAPLDAIAVNARRFLPFTRAVRTIEVLTEHPDGRWQRHWRMPLGIRR